MNNFCFATGGLFAFFFIYKLLQRVNRKKTTTTTTERTTTVRSLQELVEFSYSIKCGANDELYILLSREDDNSAEFKATARHQQTNDAVLSYQTFLCFSALFPAFQNKQIDDNAVRQFIDQTTDTPKPLTRGLIRDILLFSSEIRIRDLVEEATNSASLSSFADMSLPQIDELYARLLPDIGSLRVMLSHEPIIEFHDKAKNSGKGRSGRLEIIAVILHHWFSSSRHSTHLFHSADDHDYDNFGDEENDNNDDDNDEMIIIDDRNVEMKRRIADAELLCSRLGDREPPIGTIVRLHDSYFEYKEKFVGWGCYVSFLLNIQNNAPIEGILACRGTRMNITATSNLMSGVNDVLKEIGSIGIRKNWPLIFDFLSRNRSIKSINVCGKSLGGAHAQYLTYLISHHLRHQITVHSLVTICSVGIPSYVNRSFLLNSLSSNQMMNIIHSRNGGIDSDYDFIPHVGGILLGCDLDCYDPIVQNHFNVSLYYLTNGDCNHQHHHHNDSIVYNTILFFASLGKSHTRQSTLKEFHLLRVPDYRLKSELRKGELLENYRSTIAYLFNILTLGLLNKPFIPVQ